MKIYKDQKHTQEVKVLNLGIVPAGEEREFVYYVLNDTEATLTKLAFKVPHSEVEVVKSPQVMQRRETAELILKWCPSITLKQGLKTIIEVDGKELWS